MSKIVKLPVDAPLALPSAIAQYVEPLLGNPAWGVFRSVGSMLNMDFGEPSLLVEDARPRIPTRDKEKFGPLRRRVHVSGEWHLRIDCCDWRLLNENHLICHSESSDEALTDAVRFLTGQSLQAVSMFTGTSGTVFDFDLGGKLITMPYSGEPEYDQWVLGIPDGRYLTVRADQKYSIVPGDALPDTYKWHELWP